jgi:hypothetical protein
MSTTFGPAFNHAISQAKAIMDRADQEGRAPSEDEITSAEGWLATANRIKSDTLMRERIGVLSGPAEPGPEGGTFFKAIRDGGLNVRSGQFTSRFGLKAALGISNAPNPAGAYLYQVLPKADADESGLGYSDFVVTGTGALGSGDIVRDPTSDTPKIVLDRGVEWEQGKMDQLAVIVENIPAAVLGASAFQSYAESELRFRVDQAIDELVVDTITAASPPSGDTGADLIAQLRNGISEMRSVGSNPSIVVVDPSTAADLDLTKSTGGSEEYLFPPRATGSASPLFNLRIYEVPAATDPILVDPERLGVVRLGGASILVDPFSAFTTNLVSIRLEMLASMHVRNAEGAFIVTIGS